MWTKPSYDGISTRAFFVCLYVEKLINFVKIRKVSASKGNNCSRCRFVTSKNFSERQTKANQDFGSL